MIFKIDYTLHVLHCALWLISIYSAQYKKVLQLSDYEILNFVHFRKGYFHIKLKYKFSFCLIWICKSNLHNIYINVRLGRCSQFGTASSLHGSPFISYTRTVHNCLSAYRHSGAKRERVLGSLARRRMLLDNTRYSSVTL